MTKQQFRSAFEPKAVDVSELSQGIGGTDGTSPKSLSFIEPHEVSEVKALLDKQFVEICGKPFTGRPCGYMVVVKIYVRPEELKEITDVHGKKSILYLPDSVRAEDRFQSCIGLVIAIGDGAFKNKDGTMRYHGALPFRVGDWVQFPRSDIVRVDYRGVPLGLMTDDRALMVIDEPSDYTPGHLTTNI